MPNGVTTNYSFKKQQLGHPTRDTDLGDNLDLIDTTIKTRADAITSLEDASANHTIAINTMHTDGSSNFAGPGGVTITHNLNLSDYDVSIKPSADGGGAIGEWWVTDMAVNSFVVRNSGSGVTAFTWIIHNRT